jgi:3-phenylpropionate/cinnamic acid dioxygenase small subunit
MAQLADDGGLDEYILLFTEDATWEFPGAPRRGRAEIMAGAQQRRSEHVTGPGTASRHVITTVAIRLDDATSATADSYWSFWRDTTTSPALFNMGHYHDTVRWDDGAWRIARRQITLG